MYCYETATNSFLLNEFMMMMSIICCKKSDFASRECAAHSSDKTNL